MRRGLLLCVLVLLSGVSQSGIIRSLERHGDIDFLLDATTVYSVAHGNQRLRIYWEVPYRELLFVRVDSGYSASLEITFIAYDESENQVAGDSWRKSYIVPSYESTLLQTGRFRDIFHLHVPEGIYKAKVAIRDLYSANSGMRIMEISVPQIDVERVALSELLFKKDGIPTLTQKFNLQSKITVVHEIYNLHGLSGYTVSAFIESAGTDRTPGEIQPVETDSVATKKWELDVSHLTAGDYQLFIHLNGGSGELVDEKSKSFTIEISPFLEDHSFGEMLSQLQYIASAEEMRRLREASPEEREGEWNSFWQEKDPIPSTETNELKEEYYRRIEYANTHYGGIQQGWQTDRGKAYIIYGPPDEIERHPYELDSMPYQIWYYYSEGRKLIFVDEHGIGDYRLILPKGERW